MSRPRKAPRTTGAAITSCSTTRTDTTATPSTPRSSARCTSPRTEKVKGRRSMCPPPQHIVQDAPAGRARGERFASHPVLVRFVRFAARTSGFDPEIDEIAEVELTEWQRVDHDGGRLHFPRPHRREFGMDSTQVVRALESNEHRIHFGVADDFFDR